MSFPVKIFVLHVKHGYEARAAHMERMLGRMGIDFEYILDWDVADLTGEAISRWFKGHMGRAWPATSCAFKHVEIYLKMIAEDIPYALILEDDIFLKKNFRKVFTAALEELKHSHGTEKPFWLGMEATAMGFTPRSIRRKGQYVYPGRFVQCTGCYLANKALAKAVIDDLTSDQMDKPIDLYADSLRARGVFDAYWTHPVVAEQGSHMGLMPSAIGNPVKGPFKLVRRRATFFYKDILYYFK